MKRRNFQGTFSIRNSEQWTPISGVPIVFSKEILKGHTTEARKGKNSIEFLPKSQGLSSEK